MPTTTSAYDELLMLIELSTGLTDEQKDAYIAALEQNRFTPQMQAELREAFLREEQLLHDEIAAAETEIAHQQSILDEEEPIVDRESEGIVAQQEKDLEQETIGFTDDCNRIEREMNSSIEGHKKGKDAAEADAIRNMLKGNGQA